MPTTDPEPLPESLFDSALLPHFIDHYLKRHEEECKPWVDAVRREIEVVREAPELERLITWLRNLARLQAWTEIHDGTWTPLPPDKLLASHLDALQEVAMLYGSVLQVLHGGEWTPGNPNPGNAEPPDRLRGAKATGQPVLAALRRVALRETELPADAIHRQALLRVREPLGLYRLAIEEARRIDRGQDEPRALQALGAHLDDPILDHELPALGRDAVGEWKRSKRRVDVYLDLHETETADVTGARGKGAGVGPSRPNMPIVE